MRNFFLTLFLFCWSTTVLAGGGPEGVLLVVNSQSASSLTIANHYAKLRQIPPDNVVYLPWNPQSRSTDIDTFRRQILRPLLHTIQSRHWANQIDYIVYSSDFPWGIVLDADIRRFLGPPPVGSSERKSEQEKPAGKPEWPEYLTPIGSINGLTYLWQAVVAGQPGYFDLQSNHYMRLPIAEQRDASSVGFRGNRYYNLQGKVVDADGQRCFLSTMLGVTVGRGNSPDEVLSGLKRSAAADGTHPKGTIYFVRNGDIRSTVRQAIFPAAVEQLKKLGVAAEILEGTVPLNKDDVQGVVMGTASFDWKASGSTILPGAICEHFTSFGGVLSGDTGQTPLTEFLRYGAAGSSGTVTEPRAVPHKFPSPMIQVHYARGCTLAEAFYQSVHSPYQLLIVGDPLCRPWAVIPRVSVAGVKPGDVVRGNLTLKPTATVAEGKPVETFELFFDGRCEAECQPGGTLALDTSNLSDGYHELRVVAVGPGPIESQGRQIIPVKLNNHDRQIEASLATQGPLRINAPVTIAVRSPGSVGSVAIQGSRVVGRMSGEEGKIEIPANVLGAGPVLIRVVGLGNGGMKTNVMAQPLELTLE